MGWPEQEEGLMPRPCPTCCGTVTSQVTSLLAVLRSVCGHLFPSPPLPGLGEMVQPPVQEAIRAE